MSGADSTAHREIRLAPDEFFFNDRGELVIRNAELIDAVKAQLADDEGADVRGYAMSDDQSTAPMAISIGITRD
jgi:hypothetical protein